MADEDKALVSAVLEKVFGLPDPRVLQAVATGPESGGINSCRRRLLQTVFVGAALVVSVWTTLPDLGVENVEDLFVYFTENGSANGDLSSLMDLAQRIGGRNPYFNDELIKELDHTTYQMYLTLMEQGSSGDLQQTLQRQRQRRRQRIMYDEDDVPEDGSGDEGGDESGEEEEGGEEDLESDPGEYRDQGDGWLVPDDLPIAAVQIIVRAVERLPRGAVDDAEMLVCGRTDWATFANRWGAAMEEDLPAGPGTGGSGADRVRAALEMAVRVAADADAVLDSPLLKLN